MGLLTVIDVSVGQTLDRAFLEAIEHDYSVNDDVWQRQFLHRIVFYGARESQIVIDDDVGRFLEARNNIWTVYIPSGPQHETFPPGPYVLKDGQIFEVYRVHDDCNRAFVVATLPAADWDKSKIYINPGKAGKSQACLGIPTTSRLYSRAWKELDENRCRLAGKRVAIKDMLHMKGMRTSACSRAYHDLYPPQTVSAECLGALENSGLQIVGKTHCSSFAWREEPSECVDYPTPFNPRGDEYLSPAGSSSGSGAAIATYDWLDFAIGTDSVLLDAVFSRLSS